MAYGKQSEKLTKQEIVDKVKNCFRVAADAEEKQRSRENEDLSFQLPENQWTEEARVARGPQVVGGVAIPARPMLSISLLSQPMQLIQNQASNARLGVEIHAVSADASDDTAEIKQGLYRRIERDSNAQLARLWALNRAVQCGRGWYRVNTKYDEDADNPFDQEIVIQRIYDQSSVYIDPAAVEPDFSDARWGLISTWVPLDSFKEQYPGKSVPDSDSEYSAWEKEDPEWVYSTGERQALRVVEYWYKDVQHIEKEIAGQKRVGEIVEVKYCKVTARDVLEEEIWNGKLIPLIPVLGKELQPFDEERRWQGMVRPAMDGQRYFNYSISTSAERMALEPKSPWVGVPEQFENFEDIWAQSNIRNFSTLPYNFVVKDGVPVPPPQRAVVQTEGLSLALQGMTQARQLVQETTSVYDPSLGKLTEEPTAQSGRALLALQQQADAATGHFLWYLANISMMYEARVVLDMMRHVYDRPGRITQVLGEEDEPEHVMVNWPYVKGEGGRPQGLPEQANRPGIPERPPDMNPEQINYYDLTKGQYAITVSVGKSYQTKMQEGFEIGSRLLEAQPQLTPMIGDLVFKYMDRPGSKEIAERLARLREKEFPGIAGEDEEGITLSQAVNQLQAQQQQMQEMGQQMQAMAQALETDRAKQEATLLKAQQDNQTKIMLEKMDQQTKLITELIRAQTAGAKLQTDSANKEEDRQHEADADVFEAAHEQQMAILARHEGRPAPRGSLELEEPE